MLNAVLGLLAVFLSYGTVVAHEGRQEFRNVLTAVPGQTRHGSVYYANGLIRTMTLQDADAIRRACASIERVTPIVQRRLEVKFKDKQRRTSVSGTGVEAPQVAGQEIESGRYFNELEIKSADRVCVLGSAARTDLFGTEDPVNKSIQIAGQDFVVIGALKEVVGPILRAGNDGIYAPITTILKYVVHDTVIDSISCLARSERVLKQAKSELSNALTKQHGIQANATRDFVIFSDRDFAGPPPQLAEGWRKPMHPANLLEVIPGTETPNGFSMGFHNERRLNLGDVSAILKSCPSIRRLTPYLNTTIMLKYGSKSFLTSLDGRGTDSSLIFGQHIGSGKDITTADVAAHSPVCVLGHTTCQDLFGGEPPLGKSVLIRDQPFKVIGVFKKLGSQSFENSDDAVYVPVTTAMRLYHTHNIQSIALQARSKSVMDRAEAELTAVLKKRRPMPAGTKDFIIIRMDDF